MWVERVTCWVEGLVSMRHNTQWVFQILPSSTKISHRTSNVETDDIRGLWVWNQNRAGIISVSHEPAITEHRLVVSLLASVIDLLTHSF